MANSCAAGAPQTFDQGAWAFKDIAVDSNDVPIALALTENLIKSVRLKLFQQTPHPEGVGFAIMIADSNGVPVAFSDLARYRGGAFNWSTSTTQVAALAHPVTLGGGTPSALTEGIIADVGFAVHAPTGGTRMNPVMVEGIMGQSVTAGAAVLTGGATLGLPAQPNISVGVGVFRRLTVPAASPYVLTAEYKIEQEDD